MRPSFRALPALAAASLTSSCSFGSFQTAHTQAPGSVSVTPGVAQVFNRVDDQNGRNRLTNLGAQLGGRLGITKRVDAGLGSFLFGGVKADVKVNLLEPHRRLALSPRLGAGYRFGGSRSVGLLEGGAIASYRLLDGIEPYLGLTFANHWIEPGPPPGPLPPNVVGHRGSGDGLMQLNLGIELMLSDHIALLGEYGHWVPLNDDPGDFYAFVPTNIVGLALRIGKLRP